MKRIGFLISGLAESLTLVGFAVAGASDKGSVGFGNHTLKGLYESGWEWIERHDKLVENTLSLGDTKVTRPIS